MVHIFLQNYFADSKKHLFFFCILGVLSSVVLAQEKGSIQGQIQRQGEGIAGHRIMLIRFGPENQVERFPGQTDAQGKFLFEDLETAAIFTYFVGIRYNDQLYRSEPVQLHDTPKRTEVVITVPDQSTSQAPPNTVEANTPYIVNHLIAVGWRETQLEVREVIQLLHPGASPYVGQAPSPGAPQISLQFSLPQGYKNLRDVQGLEKEHVVRHARGLYYTTPLTPGDHRIMYTYTVPWSSKVITLLFERTLFTQTLDLLAAEEYLVSSSNLEFLGQVPLAEQAFAHFRGINVGVSARSWLQLTQRQDEYSPIVHFGAYATIIGIALLGIIISLRPRKATHS